MERNRSLDIVRGIAITFVIFGHITHVPEIRQYIWGFHIPLFFFISGVLFNPRKYDSFKSFIKTKLKSLILPYTFFYLITFAYWILIESHVRGEGLTWYSQLLGLFYGTYDTRFMNFNGALWFIPCLFSIEIIYYFISKLKSNLIIIPASFILYSIGIFTKDYLSWLPWGFNAAMIGIVFYGCGNLLKQQILAKNKINFFLHFSAIALLIGLQTILFDFSNADLAALSIDHPLTYIPVALVGIGLYVLVAKAVKHNIALEWMGKNSLVLFAFQEPVYRMVIFIVGKAFHYEIEIVRLNLALTLLCTFLTVFVIAPFAFAYNKWINPLFKRI